MTGSLGQFTTIILLHSWSNSFQIITFTSDQLKVIIQLQVIQLQVNCISISWGVVIIEYLEVQKGTRKKALNHTTPQLLSSTNNQHLLSSYYVPGSVGSTFMHQNTPKKVSTILVPILQMIKLRIRVSKGLVPRHTASKWQNQDSNRGLNNANGYTVGNVL